MMKKIKGTKRCKGQYFENLKVDEAKVKEYSAKFKRDYPFGIFSLNRKMFSISVSSKWTTKGKYLCMKCGKPMINRTNQKCVRRKWRYLKLPNNLGNHECKKCFPDGGAFLELRRSIIKE